MAFLALLKFALASGSLYLTKELGLWNIDKDDGQNIKLTEIESNEENIIVNADDDHSSCYDVECKCKKCQPPNETWGQQIQDTWDDTKKSLSTVSTKFRRFGQQIHESFLGLFKGDDK